MSGMATLLSTRDSSSLQRIALRPVTDLNGIAALQPHYETLCRAAGNRLPFALHAWHLTWCQHFLNCDARIRDRPLFYVLHESTGTCVGILPFILSRRRLGPLKVGSMNMLGADPAITEIPTPLIAPGYARQAVRAVRDALAAEPDWDWIHWGGLSGDLARALRDTSGLIWRPPLADFVLDLPPTWEQFRARLKRNIRESLRHCYNSLRRDGLTFELQVITDAAGVRRGLDRFLELHRLRADLRNTVIHPNRFASRVSRDFLHAVCERLAARGCVRLFALRIGRETVAMRLGFVIADALYLYYSGYDPRWARYSVMTTTVAEAIKYAIANRLRTVNLSPNVDQSKLRWSPRRVEYGMAYEPRQRLLSRLANGAYLRARAEDGARPSLLQRLITRRTWQ